VAATGAKYLRHYITDRNIIVKNMVEFFSKKVAAKYLNKHLAASFEKGLRSPDAKNRLYAKKNKRNSYENSI